MKFYGEAPVYIRVVPRKPRVYNAFQHAWDGLETRLKGLEMRLKGVSSPPYEEIHLFETRVTAFETRLKSLESGSHGKQNTSRGFETPGTLAN